MMDLHKEAASIMMSEEEKKRLKCAFFNYDVHLSKHRRDENIEATRLGSLGWDKAKNKTQLATGRNLMPLLNGDVRYWFDNRFLRLAWREVKYRYTDI